MRAELAALGALALAGCEPQAPATHQVTYQVSGTGRATLNVVNAQGGDEQKAVTLPWSQTITMADGKVAVVSGQLEDDGPTAIDCTILVDGAPFRHSASDGEYSVVDCSGAVGDDESP